MEHYTFQLMGMGSSACATKHKGSVVILPNFSKNKHARFCESITIFLKKTYLLLTNIFSCLFVYSGNLCLNLFHLHQPQ